MLTLPQLLLWFSFFGLPVPSSPGAIGTSWLAGLYNDVSTFVSSFVVGRLTIVLAAYFIIRAIIDSAHGGHPLASVLTAMFLLAIPTTSDLIISLRTGSRFATADILDELDALRHQVSELTERVEFAERMLAAPRPQRDPLPPGEPL